MFFYQQSLYFFILYQIFFILFLQTHLTHFCFLILPVLLFTFILLSFLLSSSFIFFFLCLHKFSLFCTHSPHTHLSLFSLTILLFLPLFSFALNNRALLLYLAFEVFLFLILYLLYPLQAKLSRHYSSFHCTILLLLETLSFFPFRFLLFYWNLPFIFRTITHRRIEGSPSPPCCTPYLVASDLNSSLGGGGGGLNRPNGLKKTKNFLYLKKNLQHFYLFG
jgi:hypothetical protein